MSHYIQDNQVIIETADNKLMLFLKGGDNNVISHSNKRCTSWFLQAVYENEAEFHIAIEVFVTSDISGGSWQFNSLKGKSFNGYFDYEATVFNRFDNALKKALKSSWKISDINVSNIHEFDFHLQELCRDNKISLQDQDGSDSKGLGFFGYYTREGCTPEQYEVSRLETKTYKDEATNKIGDFKAFCFKYEGLTKRELIDDLSFCSSFNKLNRTFGNAFDILSSFERSAALHDFSFANFDLLMDNDNSIKQLLSCYNLEKLFEVFPSHFETITIFDTFMDKVKKFADANVDGWDAERYKENYNLLKNTNFKKLRIKFNEFVETERNTSKLKFIEAWNHIVNYSYFKNTNEKLPKLIDTLEFNRTFGDIQLSACLYTEEKFEKIEEFASMQELKTLTEKHKNQYKKNQKPIKDLVKYLIDTYSDVIEDDVIEHWCNYFGLKKQTTEVEVKEEIKQDEVPPSIVAASLYDQVDINNFNSGSLF